MANRWRKRGNSVKYELFLGSKTNADGDCSHKIKRRLVLGRKAKTNLDSVLKSRDTFANKGPSSQSYVFVFVFVFFFPVVMYGCETWT